MSTTELVMQEFMNSTVVQLILFVEFFLLDFQHRSCYSQNYPICAQQLTIAPRPIQSFIPLFRLSTDDCCLLPVENPVICTTFTNPRLQHRPYPQLPMSLRSQRTHSSSLIYSTCPSLPTHLTIHPFKPYAGSTSPSTLVISMLFSSSPPASPLPVFLGEGVNACIYVCHYCD